MSIARSGRVPSLAPGPNLGSAGAAVVAALLPAAIALATFVAATPWLRAYQISGQAALLAAASAVPVLIVVAVARRMVLTTPYSYGFSASALAVFLISAADLDTGSVWRSIVDGPDRLLSETLPLTGSRSVLAPVLVLTWLCGATSAELVLRGRSRRGGWAELGLAVPVVAYVLAYSVAAGAPGKGWWAAPLLLIAIAAGATAKHAEATPAGRRAGFAGEDNLAQEARPPRRRPVVAAAVATVVVAVLLAAVVPSMPRFEGRPASLNKPAHLFAGVVIDPVGAIGSFRDADLTSTPRQVLRIVTPRSTGGYLSAAVLGSYDGSQWTFDTTFKPTGGRVPVPPDSLLPLVGAQTVEVTETVTSTLPVPFLPVLDRPLSVAGGAVAADPVTGMVLPARDARLPANYEVVSRVPAANLDAVPGADGIGSVRTNAAQGSAADSAIPPDSSLALATAVRFVAGLTGTRPAPTVAFMQQVMAALHADEKRLSPGAASSSPGQASPPSTSTPPTTTGGAVGRLGGTSLSEVINAVTVNRSATPEQFATFYALVARYLGVPSRLVTGFRLAPRSSGAPLPPGAYRVDSRQAWTWVEIPVSGMGWVVADPTPDAVTGVSAPPPEQVQAPATTLAPSRANAVPRNEATGGHAIAKPTRSKVHHPEAVPPWALASLFAVALVLVALTAGPGLAALRRWRRRRSRRTEDPAALATGAWLELLDGLFRAGMVIRPGATSSEVANEAGRHFGPGVTPVILDVGELADQAVCSTRSTPDSIRAEEAWRSQRALTRTVHRGLDRRQRVRALIAVGSSPRRPEG